MNKETQIQWTELLVSRSFCPARDREGLGRGQTVDIWGEQSKNTKGMEMSEIGEGKLALKIQPCRNVL